MLRFLCKTSKFLRLCKTACFAVMKFAICREYTFLIKVPWFSQLRLATVRKERKSQRAAWWGNRRKEGRFQNNVHFERISCWPLGDAVSHDTSETMPWRYCSLESRDLEPKVIAWCYDFKLLNWDWNFVLKISNYSKSTCALSVWKAFLLGAVIKWGDCRREVRVNSREK